MKHLIACLSFAIATLSAHAFALRGPLEPWMTTNLSYGLRGDNGGPMALGNEYRWNLPVLTYGFDQSFLNHFGERGVQAVEEAIAILNALPAASEMDLDAFPLDTTFHDYELQTLGLVDLKSLALSVLVRQLGLIEPERFVWTLRSRQVAGRETNYTVIQRNYDPTTIEESGFVNRTEYTYEVYTWPLNADAAEFAVDPFAPAFNSVANYLYPGEYYRGLTRDDVGGLRYLYHSTNINVEPLPGEFTAADSSAVVNVAPRPGVNKITFVPMQWDTNRSRFRLMTNVLVDTYLSNGVPVQQTLERVLDRPDITFRARDLGVQFYYDAGFDAHVVSGPLFNSSAVSEWMNNAALNDRLGAAGPGTSPSGQVIDFSTLSRYRHAQLGSPNTTFVWSLASFDDSTNALVYYGLNDTATSATIESRVINGSFVWKLLGTYEAVYRIDSTTNLVDWSPLTTVTNTRGYFSITNPISGPRQFYRAIRTAVPGE